MKVEIKIGGMYTENSWHKLKITAWVLKFYLLLTYIKVARVKYLGDFSHLKILLYYPFVI